MFWAKELCELEKNNQTKRATSIVARVLPDTIYSFQRLLPLKPHRGQHRYQVRCFTVSYRFFSWKRIGSNGDWLLMDSRSSFVDVLVVGLNGFETHTDKAGHAAASTNARGPFCNWGCIAVSSVNHASCKACESYYVHNGLVRFWRAREWGYYFLALSR